MLYMGVYLLYFILCLKPVNPVPALQNARDTLSNKDFLRYYIMILVDRTSFALILVLLGFVAFDMFIICGKRGFVNEKCVQD